MMTFNRLVARQLLSFGASGGIYLNEVFMNELVLMLMTIAVVVFLWNT